VNQIGHQCPFCGTWYLLRASFERHRAEEIPRVQAYAAERQAEYERQRAERRKDFQVWMRDRPLPGSPSTQGEGR
jgi:hypothetical protein